MFSRTRSVGANVEAYRSFECASRLSVIGMDGVTTADMQHTAGSMLLVLGGASGQVRVLDILLNHRKEIVIVELLCWQAIDGAAPRSEENTSELQSLMRISYAVFCLKKKTQSPNQS